MKPSKLYVLFLFLLVHSICGVGSFRPLNALKSKIFEVIEEVSFYDANCHCANRACNCCTGVRIRVYNFDNRVCAIVKYLSRDIGVEASLTVNQNEIISRSVSLRNPPPLCASVFRLRIIKLCVHFYDLHVVEDELRGCIDLEAGMFPMPAMKLHVGCFRIT